MQNYFSDKIVISSEQFSSLNKEWNFLLTNGGDYLRVKIDPEKVFPYSFDNCIC